MEFTYFIGTDVSKNELDFAVMQGKTLLFHREIVNKREAIHAFVKEITCLARFRTRQSSFLYGTRGHLQQPPLGLFAQKKADACLAAATQIKNSPGNIRGKNDKTDAARIAEYAYKNREEGNQEGKWRSVWRIFPPPVPDC